jgi:hypothetical protein
MHVTVVCRRYSPFFKKCFYGLYLRSFLFIGSNQSDFEFPDFSLSPSAPPTILQFGCNSPLELSRATTLLAPFVNGVDINCGCPQSWACAETLGAALMHKRELVAEMVKEATSALQRKGFGGKKTVSVKIRIHKDLRDTISYEQLSQPVWISSPFMAGCGARLPLNLSTWKPSSFLLLTPPSQRFQMETSSPSLMPNIMHL